MIDGVLWDRGSGPRLTETTCESMHICEGADLLPSPLLVTFFGKGDVPVCGMDLKPPPYPAGLSDTL